MPNPFARHKVATILSAIILLPLLVFVLWTVITLSYTYSSGERAGLMSAVPGSAPEKFLFTVRSDSVAAEINKLSGRRVVLDYEQHVKIPTSCFGDTEYFVNGVRAMTDSMP